MEIILTDFLKKNHPFRVSGLFYAPKWRILISLDPLLTIFLKLRTMKGAKRYMELILMVFSEKNLTWDKWAAFA